MGILSDQRCSARAAARPDLIHQATLKAGPVDDPTAAHHEAFDAKCMELGQHDLMVDLFLTRQDIRDALAAKEVLIGRNLLPP